MLATRAGLGRPRRKSWKSVGSPLRAAERRRAGALLGVRLPAEGLRGVEVVFEGLRGGLDAESLAAGVVGGEAASEEEGEGECIAGCLFPV